MANDPEIHQVLLKNKERIYISCKIEKINGVGKIQERIFLVTTHAVYNIDPFPTSWAVWAKGFFTSTALIKRRIKIEKIESISLSLKSHEFVLHVPSEYDYRYQSEEHRNEILEAVVASKLRKSEYEKFKIYYHNHFRLTNVVQ